MPEKSAHAISSAPMEHDHEAISAGRSYSITRLLLAAPSPGRSADWPESVHSPQNTGASQPASWQAAGVTFCTAGKHTPKIGQLPHVAVAAITRTA